MPKITGMILIISMILIMSMTIIAVADVSAGETSPQIVLFKITPCDNCETVTERLAEMNIVPSVFDIADAAALDRLKLYISAYNIPSDLQQLPLVFAGDRYFTTQDVLGDGLAQYLSANPNPISPSQYVTSYVESVSGIENDNSASTVFDTPKFVSALTAGLLNGFNPCGVSMLLFFITLIGAKNNTLRYGLAYMAGKTLLYLLAGVAGYALLGKLLLALPHIVITIFNLALFIAALVVAGLSFRDFYMSRHERYDKIALQLPLTFRKMCHQLIKRFASLGKWLAAGCFAAGFIVSAVEFLCTGQAFLASILYAAQDGNISPWLYIVYALAALVPPSIIIVLLSKGRAALAISEPIRKNMPVIKLVNGVFFLLFAAMILILFVLH
jgi:cytochrome c biogenesis protein CcdA